MNKRKVSILVLLFCFWLGLSFADDCFTVYGDTRNGHEIHQKIADAMLKMKPAAAFHTGDLVDNGENPGDWMIFARITSGLRAGSAMYPALGNHERQSKLYFEEFPLLNNRKWYSVEAAGARFIVLDSNSSLKRGSEQYRWLKETLASAGKEKKFIIVLMHQPIFSISGHYKEGKPLQGILCPLFERYGVSIVFSGHDHNYQRLLYRNVFYIVTGGGGAPLYDQVTTSPYSQVFKKVNHFCRLCVKGNRLALEVFDAELNPIDEIQITKI